MKESFDADMCLYMQVCMYFSFVQGKELERVVRLFCKSSVTDLDVNCLTPGSSCSPWRDCCGQHRQSGPHESK